jgi:hypothetical protein
MAFGKGKRQSLLTPIFLTRECQLTKVFKELRDIEWSARTLKQKQKVIGITVEGTGRSTPIPPLVAPYDFGIDKTWWRVEAGEYPAHVADWFTHGNPDGFEDRSDDEETIDLVVEGIL